MSFKSFISGLLNYNEDNSYSYTLSQTQPANNLPNENKPSETISSNLKENLQYINVRYNALLNSDINIRNFNIHLKNKQYPACIVYIDGMVNSQAINDFLLKPLMLKNKSNSSSADESIVSSNKDNINIEKKVSLEIKNYIYNTLIPQNSIKTTTQFDNAIDYINKGFTALFIDTIDTAFCIEAKGYSMRSISTPNNEIVVRGSQEAFVENIRTNTSMLRRIINNENLIIEQFDIGKVSKTTVGICYMKNITNEDLVNEVKYRINNIDIDSIISSGVLEQLIQDSTSVLFPQMFSTERSDRACYNLLEGRVVVLVNGSPYALIAPATFIDFLSSPEDLNLKYHYSNLLKIIRIIAFVIAMLLPGLYVAITVYHQELIPTDLLFAIAAVRKSIPFPVIFEILIMELSFELIREGSLRIPAAIGSTIGIIGGLILGDAAVAANIVSPLLIIIVAMTGICSFAIPDFSMGFAVRIFRFMYIVLGYIAGLLGISLGIFIQIILLANLKSFGVSYFSPYVPVGNKNTNNSYFLKPIWKREKRSNFLNTKRPEAEGKISITWKKNN